MSYLLGRSGVLLSQFFEKGVRRNFKTLPAMLYVPMHNLSSLVTKLTPRLPPEIVEEVMIRAWELPCTMSERILFMTSLPLVNRDVLATFIQVSSVDVHIPCPSFVDRFLRAICEGARPFPIMPTRRVSELCRSITLQILQPSSPIRAVHWSAEPPMGVALSDLLYHIRVFGGLPNFRTLTVRYIDVDPYDIFDWARFIDFPDTVEFLNLESLRTETEISPPKIVITPPGRSPNADLWMLPNVRRLRVSGADQELISRLIMSMPNLEFCTKKQKIS